MPAAHRPRAEDARQIHSGITILNAALDLRTKLRAKPMFEASL